MIVTVKNEVNRARGRQRAHRNKGLRGPSSGSTRDKTKIVFFEPEIWAIPTCAHRSRARIDPFAFNSLAAWERKRIRFNGDISTVRFISTAGLRILSVFISTTDASILSPSIRSPHGSTNGYASMETYLLFALYLPRIIGSLGQLWNALELAPRAMNELLNWGLSSRFFSFVCIPS